MTRKERWQFWILWLALGLAPLFLRPLWEPDEARYAEIPREMLRSGDWLTPTLNQVAYFEKPPLQYWLSAASMKLFGVQPWAARLPLALASLLALWAAWRLARRLGAPRPLWAAFMAATMLLGFFCGQVLTLDALFAAFLAVALCGVVEAVGARCAGGPALPWTLLAFGALAAATLTKGIAAPVLLGGAALASLVWTRGEARLRRAVLRTLFDPLGWVLLLALTVPWFVAVDRANPGHARFFFIHEHFARFTSHVHRREASSNWVVDKLYFPGVFLVGVLPWLAASLLGLRRAWGFLRRRLAPAGEAGGLNRWTVALLLAAFAMPMLFFSASGSKLYPYILPVAVPVAVLACAFAEEVEGWAPFRRAGRELLLLGLLAVLGGAALGKEAHVLPLALAAGLALALTGLWALRPRHLTAIRWAAALGASLLLLVVAAQRAVGASKSVDHLVARAPAGAQWMSIGYYHQGIAFRTGTRVTVVAGAGELAFGRDRLPEAEQRRWFPEAEDLEAAAARLRAEAPERPVWAIAARRFWERQPEARRAAWEVVASTRSHRLLRMR